MSEQTEDDRKRKRDAKIFVGVLFVISVLYYFARPFLFPGEVAVERIMATATAQRAAQRPTSVASLSVGKEGRIVGAPRAFAATDTASWDEMWKLITVRDDLGLNQMVISGKVLLVDTGTRVLAIEATASRVRLRILDGKHAGKSAWFVPSDAAP